MSTSVKSRPWDLSHVLELVNSLSTSDRESNENDHPERPPIHARHWSDVTPDHVNRVEKRDFAIQSTGLGDFGKIWHYLGAPQPSPSLQPPQVHREHATSNDFPNKDDYASDGAIQYGLRNKVDKSVRWKEETSADEPTPQSGSERSDPDEQSERKLSKSAQKRKNRKERRKAKDVAHRAVANGVVSESEADNLYRQTPARKASTHFVTAEPTHRYNLRSRNSSGRAVTPDAEKTRQNGTLVGSSTPKINGDAKCGPSRKFDESNGISTPERIGHSIQTMLQPVTGPSQMQGQDETCIKHSAGIAEQPVPMLPSPFSAKLIPSSVQPKAKKNNEYSFQRNGFSEKATQAVQAVQAAQVALLPQQPSTHTPKLNKISIEPKIVRSGEDRHWALLLKLINDYPEDRRCLVAPMNMTTHNNDPKGIHVFVDASNIFIGFNDQLKRSRGISISAHVPQVDLSFDALALLMERRRSVARRVLVGSTPHLLAFDKAKSVGYECNILEKVFKAKELTERQVFFRDIDQRRSGRRAEASAASAGLVKMSTTPPSRGNGFGGGYSSGSETTARGPQYAPAKMIEQGVDEILHLKILESIVDTEIPSTMVLATGDAAQAEYSEGFMAMAQRALKKGWKVELVSWSQNISSMYLRKQFRDFWGTSFKVVLLDDYAEELLDM